MDGEWRNHRHLSRQSLARWATSVRGYRGLGHNRADARLLWCRSGFFSYDGSGPQEKWGGYSRDWRAWACRNVGQCATMDVAVREHDDVFGRYPAERF